MPIKPSPEHSRKTIAIVYNTASYLWISRQPLLRALLAAGYRLIAIAPAAPEQQYIQELGIKFLPLRHLDRRGTNPIRDWHFYRELKQIYQAESVDLALHFTIKPVIYGSLAAAATGRLSVNTITGLGYSFIKGGWMSRLVKQLYRLALSRASFTLFQNPDDRRLFLEASMIQAGQSGLVPGSGIDIDFFNFEPLPKKEELQFLYVGRLLGDKGVREFVAAANELRARGFSFQGTDLRESKKISEQNAEIKIRCSIIGGIDHQNPAAVSEAEVRAWAANAAVEYLGTTTDVRSHIINCSAVVLPSYREGLPRVLLEGAATGRPLIATDVPGCREVVEPGCNGYLVPAKDAVALADAMQQMAALKVEERAAMGRCSRQRAEERFEAKLVVKHYLELLEKLLAD